MKNVDFQPRQNMTIGYLATAITAEDVQTWPDHSRNAALEMISKYGLPDVMSSEVMIWKREADPLVVEKNIGLIGKAS
ncbi:MAG TPA: hypothetical protein VF676_06520 [Flavobacterium sp.]